MQPWIALSRRELLAERSEASGDDVHFPERLAEQVVARFSAPGEVILDPFAGSGTVAAVAVRMGRRAIAVELLPARADEIRRRTGPGATVITGDALDLASLVRGPIDLCLTSPPYMTRSGHPENPLTGYRTLDGRYEIYLDQMERIGIAIAGLFVREATSW